jgi:dipeptidyl aminopeptidase/acylaminoacyl peptidase
MNPLKIERPFGMWDSPIQPAALAQHVRLSGVGWAADGETLIWLEGRSDRGVLVCAPPGQAPRDLTSTLSVRARVGYGGGDFGVGDGWVYFCAEPSGLYRQSLAGGEAEPITPEFGEPASPTPSPDGKWLLYVHSYKGVDGLAIVDAAGATWPQKLAYGADFYMQPCWHPDSTRIAWISWDHPNMPWDSTRLHLAALDARAPGRPALVNHEILIDRSDVAVFQPEFSPDGRWLAYVSDESGWGSLHIFDLETGTHRSLTADCEVGVPAWIQGLRTYGWSLDSQRLFYLRHEAGSISLRAVGVSGDKDQALTALTEYSAPGHLSVAPKTGKLAAVASSSTVSDRIVVCSENSPSAHILRRSTGETVLCDALSVPEPISWTAPDGTMVYGLYYPPSSVQFTARGRPPAIVNVHGGPTGQSNTSYNARAQFFTTRGYAYLEVNYRGSTGYGKGYMSMLRGQWGVLDVEDAVGGATYLVEAGLADPGRLAIMGGSAGGYTVLKALVDHPGFFKAALCLYGVSNMFTLAADTHKFEQHYLDSMLGPLPDASDIYRARSPIYHAEHIVDPIAIFQGEIDRVVPQAQSEAIVESLRQRGVPHEYHVYKGEGHGWRKKETIETFYQSVERFLRQYVIFG